MNPGAHYSALVSVLERESYTLNSIAKLAEIGSPASPALPVSLLSAQEALALIDKSPLYSFSDAARVRCHTLHTEGKLGRDIPTMPARGVVLLDSVNAVFLMPRDDILAPCHAILEAASGGRRIRGCYEYMCMQESEDSSKYGAFTHGLVISSEAPADLGSAASAVYIVKLIALNGADTSASHITVLASYADANSVSCAVVGEFNKHRKLVRSWGPTKDVVDAILINEARHTNSALDQLRFVDMPSHYVVEERPEHVSASRGQEGKQPKKVPRYPDRERWCILDPEEVRVHFTHRSDAAAVGSHASPTPHLRRSHIRTLRSDRYKFRKGETLNIRPTWVGERAWANGRMRYSVVSRPGAEENQA